MPYTLNDQYIDISSGFHVLELRNEHGHKHLLQIAIGHDSCPLCGHATVRDHEGIDVPSILQSTVDTLAESEQAVKAHAAKHGVQIK